MYQKSVIGYLHTLSGGVFFLTLAFYSLYHFPRAVSGLESQESHPWERNFVYRMSGIVILLSMIAMATYMVALPNDWKNQLNDYNFLFWMEWVAVWSFAAAWLTKGNVIVAEIAVELLSIPREAIAGQLNGSRTSPPHQ